MESACMESANHTLHMTCKTGLNCFPSNGRSASAEAAPSRCCTQSICTDKHVIASLTLLTTVCARTGSTDLSTRSCRRNTAPRDRDKHAYITLHTLLTVNTYIMLAMISRARNTIVRCTQSRARIQGPFRRPHSTCLQALECQQPQSPRPHPHPLV